MRYEEFKIGMEFTTAGGLSGRWRCTDVGTRAIVAIQIEPGNDPSWCNGPPYAVAEFVFDEDDIVACKKCERNDRRLREHRRKKPRFRQGSIVP
jgi:hypothetical protein